MSRALGAATTVQPWVRRVSSRTGGGLGLIASVFYSLYSEPYDDASADTVQ